MSNILMGAVVTVDGPTTATYYIEEGGQKTVATRSSDWPQDVVDTAASLVTACQNELAGSGPISFVQVYTVITDPDGAPPYSQPGQVVDVYFSAIQSVRFGQTAPVPDDVAKSRDAFKLAVQSAL